MKWMWSVMAVGLMVAPAGLADAAQRDDEPRPVVRRIVDPVSGTELRVHRAVPGDALFEVAGERVTVRKSIARASSTTTVTTPDERVEVVVSREGVRLDGPDGVLIARRGDLETGLTIRARLAGSRAVAAALALLTEAGGGPRSPVTQALVATRVTLGALAGDPIARGTLGAAASPRVQPVALTPQDGPGDCWDMYVEEAVEAYMEYEDCVDNTNWYDVVGLASCLTIYEMRAVGAFSWWLSCTAIRA
jgi:hypothetical protein